MGRREPEKLIGVPGLTQLVTIELGPEIGSWDRHSLFLFSIPYGLTMSFKKLVASKQHTFIIWEFCRSEVWHGSHWAVMKVLAGLPCFFSGGFRHVPRPFPASRGCLHPLDSGPLPPSSKPAYWFSLTLLPSSHIFSDPLFCLPFVI